MYACANFNSPYRVDEVSLPPSHPKKAFILGALEREIRLSFASRIRGTLPEPYHILIAESKEQDIPPFKYASDQTPYAEPARALFELLRTKAPDEELAAGPLAAIESLATDQGVSDPSIPSTDAYITSICYLGSKSLSHMLSQIERCKERLLSLGPRSEPAARMQIISSVLDYWSEKPGVGVNVVDKLLNYTILTPQSVVLWAVGPDNLGIGQNLCKEHVYEMVASTIHKVTQRVRQIVTARINLPDIETDQIALLNDTLTTERSNTAALFALILDAVTPLAEGTSDAMLESAATDDGVQMNLLKIWGRKWQLRFRRWQAVEEAWCEETLSSAVEVRKAEEEAAKIVSAIAGKERGRREEIKMDIDATVNGNGIANGNTNGDVKPDDNSTLEEGSSMKKARIMDSETMQQDDERMAPTQEADPEQATALDMIS